jgi:L-fucose isomerase-like protein
MDTTERVGIRIGVAPVRRKGFPEADALASKKRLIDRISRLSDGPVEYVGIEDIVENGMIYRAEDLERVAAHLTNHQVDGLFIFHADFGEEEVVARLAKAVGKPVLLWGERDESPDPTTGIRTRDTQCGMFASTKVLMRYGIPFSYIVNCSVDDARLADGLDQFARVANVVKAMSSMRIAQISTRPRPFFSVMANEGELLERFGIEIVPINVTSLMGEIEATKTKRTAEVADAVAATKGRMDSSEMTEVQLENLAALRIALQGILETNGCHGAAIECWSMLLKELGVMPCLVVGELSDMGMPVACETDIHGAITSILLQAAGMGQSPTFFADLTIRHPDNDNAELLWHCGPFPYSLKDEAAQPAVDGGKGQWKLKDGDITLARFDSLAGSYSLLSGHAKTVDGPKTIGTYVWVETDDWERWERKFIYGPYIHHVAGIYGSYSQVLTEACRFIDGLEPDTP